MMPPTSPDLSVPMPASPRRLAAPALLALLAACPQPMPLDVHDTDLPGTPVDCELDFWSDWSDCSEACEGGVQTRSRAVITEPKEGGDACDATVEERECHTDPCTTGEDVRVVRYDGGAFSQLNSTLWVENGLDARRSLVEAQRDEWSVYLHPAGGGVVQLDLFTEQVKVTPPDSDTSSVRDTIVDAQPNLVDGWAATHATYGTRGAFVQLDGDSWVENNVDGVHTWTELRRDAWSVYLRNDERGASMRLDIYTMEAEVQFEGQDAYVLYTLSSADPRAIHGWLMREAVLDEGLLTQTGPTTWMTTGLTAGGRQMEQLTRNGTSVVLYDDVTQDTYEISTTTQQVRRTPFGSGTSTPVADILHLR